MDCPCKVPFGCRHVYLWAHSGRNDRSCTGISELSGGSREVARNLSNAGEHEESCQSRLKMQCETCTGIVLSEGNGSPKLHQLLDEHSCVVERHLLAEVIPS